MGITITSVLTSCILNSLLILVLCIVFRRNSVMYRIGPGCMIVFYVAVILRMFVPLGEKAWLTSVTYSLLSTTSKQKFASMCLSFCSKYSTSIQHMVSIPNQA